MELLKIKKQRKNKRYSLLIIMGIFLFLFSISYLIYNHYENEKQKNTDNQMINEFFEVKEEIIEEKIIQEKQSIKQDIVVNYMGILEIPKINLKRGLFDKNSSRNNVNRNIYILKESTLPDEQSNSHIILASHTGNSNVSYFKNLKKLNMNDDIYFYYKGIKYMYKVSNRYEIEKNGTVELKQTNMSDITLITCIRGTNKQVVYVGNLVSEEDY